MAAPAWRQAIAPIGVGTLALLITGVNPIVLGALADAGRLSAAGIGQAAMLELLAMGVAAGGAGAILQPSRLRLIGLAAGLAMAAANLATLGATGTGVIAARAAAGLAEGVLVWISIGFIVRQATPERWAGVYFMAQTLTQLALATALTGGLIARFGANGAFVVLAGVGLLTAGLSLAGPNAYAPLEKGEGLGHLPNRAGWIALAAVLVFTGGGTGVWVYLQPLANRADLAAGVAGMAVSASLIGQVTGAALATLSAGRLRYVQVFTAAGVVFLAVWATLAGAPTAAVFVLGVGLTGFVGIFVSPYLVPLLIEADPTRRAAELSGGAQLLGAALGPLLASLIVSDAEPRGVLLLGGVSVILSVGVVIALHRAAVRR